MPGCCVEITRLGLIDVFPVERLVLLGAEHEYANRRLDRAHGQERPIVFALVKFEPELFFFLHARCAFLPVTRSQRFTMTSQYFGSISKIRAFRFDCSHAIMVVPEPPK